MVDASQKWRPQKRVTPLRNPGILERVMGIEPTLSAWEAEVLPLNYTRQEALLTVADITASWRNQDDNDKVEALQGLPIKGV